ncbi:hybrid sensor histidine kinase/response regulator [Roseibium sp. MMSF_3412]|uniref:ATP-binding response regulator n=1 Tax=Roseibium sp. MMSF_3412 TaxID=3046712 RepID=UPI00273E5411|nr:hybrid sensor histidine kinase/response regulator [Roseibium sp. MMSF_3412]
MPDRDDEAVKLALLAHDLRTPLAAMRLTAELIGSKPLDEDQFEKLSILIRSIDALTDMTGELVEAVRSGEEPAPSQQNVADIMRDCAELFQVAADEKGLVFRLHIEPDACDLVTSQAAELRRIVTTLLDNAVKYTDLGSVDVGVSKSTPPAADHTGEEPDFVGVSITDTGPGIDPEEETRLFRPFSRGKRGLETTEGSGLGLWGAACQSRKLGGQLRLVRPEAGGSRFELRVPAQRGISSERQPVLENIPRAEKTNAAAAAAHVLIVDDNETNCRLMSALMESFGYSFDVVHSGDEALEALPRHAYDAVLLDLNMPGKSGVETAREIKADPTYFELPLIAVTAALEAVGEAQLHAAGFEDVIAKPLSPADLFAALERARVPPDGSEAVS